MKRANFCSEIAYDEIGFAKEDSNVANISILKAFIVGIAVMFSSVGSPQQAGPGRTGTSAQGSREPSVAFVFAGAFKPFFLSFLLSRPDVQKELKLTEAQKKSLQTRLQSFGPRQREQSNQASPRTSGGQGQRAQQPNVRDIDKVIRDILTPAQQKRLEELQLQWVGPGALLWPDVAQKVGLTNQQTQKIREAEQANMQKRWEVFQRARTTNQAEREKLFQQMELLRRDLNNKILALLTPAQKQKWQSLLGKPFTFNPPRGTREIRRTVPVRPL